MSDKIVNSVILYQQAMEFTFFSLWHMCALVRASLWSQVLYKQSYYAMIVWKVFVNQINNIKIIFYKEYNNI